MSENVRETEDAGQSTSAQEAAIDEVEGARGLLRISPRRVLASLSHLRIDRARIKPIEDQVPKAGGKADVQAAMLASAPFSTLSEPDGAEYVAIKKLRLDEDTDDDRALAPLAHEVKLLSDLSHENVVKIIAFVEEVEQGVAWMVFAWEKNGNLREFIRSAKWELPERIFLIDDVARGLSYLHERNPPICHGDLKSLNILVNSKNRALITDFGSARAVGSVEEEAVKGVGAAKAASTSSPAATGAQNAEVLSAEIAPSGDFITMTGPAWTVRWAAPELLSGYLPGLASDIWALGWICWEAVTGNFPFDKENDTAVVLRIAKGDLPTIENDDQLKQMKTLCSLMRECWTLDMHERPTALRCQKIVQWMVQLQNDMYTEAREYFEQSLKVAESVENADDQAWASKAIGDTFYLQGEYTKAEEWYIRARDICSLIRSELGLAWSTKGLGNVYYMRDEYSKAEELYIQARDMYSQIGSQIGFAQSVQSLGDVYHIRDEYSEAEESYIRAREIYSQIGELLGFAQSVKSLGDVYRLRSEYPKAEESYNQASSIYRQTGDQLGFAQLTRSLGDLHRMREEYSNAEESYILARDIYCRVGNQLGVGQALEGMGRVHSARGEHAKAEESYSEAQQIYHRVGDVRSMADILFQRAQLHGELAQYGEAERLVREASTVFDQLGLAQDVEACNRFLEENRRSM
ncbi:hypothetical protein FS837_012274 [Tulasnella sp. UAMH 9824]|nr:hypothetical protein FS837_012274 [Tulasnella sp. UAMH 9824]